MWRNGNDEQKKRDGGWRNNNNNYNNYNNHHQHRNNNYHDEQQSKRYKDRNNNTSSNLTPKEKEINRARDYLFRGIDRNKRNQLQLDDTATFSVTESGVADQMTATILKQFETNVTYVTKDKDSIKILDGMACVGGNTISFAKSFTTVLSNEFNKTRYDMLINNVHGVMNFENVQFFNNSILDLALHEVYDILFLDPEWGGPDYKFKKNLRLTIGDTPIEEFCISVFQRCSEVSMIALKLPVNYDNIYLRDMMKSHQIIYLFDNTFHKMTLTMLIRPPLPSLLSSSSSLPSSSSLTTSLGEEKSPGNGNDHDGVTPELSSQQQQQQDSLQQTGYQFRITTEHEGYRFELIDISQGDGAVVSYQIFLEQLESNQIFRVMLTKSIVACNVSNFFWECVPVSFNLLSTTPFQFMLLPTSPFPETPDYHSFANHFEAKSPLDSVITFKNLRGDADLIVPCPCPCTCPPIDHENNHSYSSSEMVHLGSYLRNGHVDQINQMWKLTAEMLRRRLNQSPEELTWLSTHGKGVYWIHIRLDSEPKYYHCQEYKTFQQSHR